MAKTRSTRKRKTRRSAKATIEERFKVLLPTPYFDILSPWVK
jgi:hypothetical protein